MIGNIAVFPGSFDPVTYGHIDVVSRAMSMFDYVFVMVGRNTNKSYLFNDAERGGMLLSCLAYASNVRISVFDGLVVDFCRSVGAKTIVRGVRNSNDVEFEMRASYVNNDVASIDTVFFPTRSTLAYVSSSMVKELAWHGVDVSGYVPPVVNEAIKLAYKKKHD